METGFIKKKTYKNRTSKKKYTFHIFISNEYKKNITTILL